MLAIIKQTLVMTRIDLISLRRRLAFSCSMAFSVALVVCILVGFLSMASGFEAVLKNTGSSAVAVVLGGGTSQEIDSDIPADAIRVLQATRSDIGVMRDAAGDPVLSRELVQPVAQSDADGQPHTLSLRGMDPEGAALRDGISLTEGRLFGPGAREIAVGAQLAADFPNFAVGRTVRLGAVDWTVVGHYTAGGSAFESEIWTGLDAAQAAFDRQGEIQTLRLRLADPGNVERLQSTLSGLSTTPFRVVSEADLFAGQSQRTVDLIRLFGWPIALLMGFGATAGALNTMLSSVSDRTVEIATMRAIGFSQLSAFNATWIESIFIAAVGTALGLSASLVLFSGWHTSTLGANNARMAFQLVVDNGVILTAGVLGIGIGIVGGLLPAISATRIPLIAALRARN
jgi:putative ABC transport system permease protein